MNTPSHIRTLLAAAVLLATATAHASAPAPAGDGQRLVSAIPFAGAIQQLPQAADTGIACGAAAGALPCQMVTVAPPVDPTLDVPEPATAALVAAALGAMALSRRRRR